MQDSYDFIFFDPELRNGFVEFVESQGITCQLREDPLGFIVALPDSIDDDLLDHIEQRYEEFEQAQAERMSQTQGGLQQLAGIRFELPDGRSCMVPLEVDMAHRLLASFSIEEVQQLFQSVIDSAQASDSDRPLCQTLRAAAHERKR